MYKKGTGNNKQRKDAGNRTLCPYRNFSQAIITQRITLDGKLKPVKNFIQVISGPDNLIRFSRPLSLVHLSMLNRKFEIQNWLTYKHGKLRF